MSKKYSVAWVLFCVMAVSFCFSFASLADWEGNVTIKASGGGKKDAPAMSGLMRMKKDKMRMDMKAPAEISTIINMKTKKAWSLMHAQKMVMEVDLATVEDQAPMCGTDDVDGCYKKQGLKKTGTETIDGHPCTIYEGDIESKKDKTEKTHVKIWRPNDLKEVPGIKSVMTMSSGQTAETNYTNIKVVAQADHLFSVPKNYKSMGNVQDILKNIGKGGFKIPGR